MPPGFYFTAYGEWRSALTVRRVITLTPNYAGERIAALRNPAEHSMAEFIKFYGEAYRRQVIAWFERAERKS